MDVEKSSFAYPGAAAPHEIDNKTRWGSVPRGDWIFCKICNKCTYRAFDKKQINIYLINKLVNIF